MNKLLKVPLWILLPTLVYAQINASFVGQTATKIQILCVADSVLAEDNYTTPEIGNKFIAVKLRLDNSSNPNHFYFSFLDLMLRDAKNNQYKSNLKTYVVRTPFLTSALVAQGECCDGWVTFEVPKNLYIYCLQLRLNQNEHYCTDWIPFWPVVANVYNSKKFTQPVSSVYHNSFSQTKSLLWQKTLQSIDDYLHYLKTKRSAFLVEAIRNASQAHLLIGLIKRKYSETYSNELCLLDQIIVLLNENIPQKMMQQNYSTKVNVFSIPLLKMRGVVLKNYATTQKST